MEASINIHTIYGINTRDNAATHANRVSRSISRQGKVHKQIRRTSMTYLLVVLSQQRQSVDSGGRRPTPRTAAPPPTPRTAAPLPTPRTAVPLPMPRTAAPLPMPCTAAPPPMPRTAAPLPTEMAPLVQTIIQPVQNEIQSQVNYYPPTRLISPTIPVHNPLHRTDYAISSYSTLTYALTPGARLTDISIPPSNTSASHQYTVTTNEVQVSTYSSLAGALGDL